MQVGFINSTATDAGIEQTLTDILTAGLTYTLQADFAYPNDFDGAQFALVLLAGNTELASFIGDAPEFSSARASKPRR